MVKERPWDTFLPGSKVTKEYANDIGYIVGVVQKFNKTKFKKAFSGEDRVKVTENGFWSGDRQFIQVKFYKKNNPSLSYDWDTYMAIHTLKAFKPKKI